MDETKPTRSSPWFDSVPDELRWKPLRSNVHADITVIGAGMVGVLAAWYLAKTGKHVVLLEKNRVATGETGFSTAFLTRIPDVSSLSGTVKKYSVGYVENLLAANRAMQRELFSLIEQEHIDCDFHLCSSYYFSCDEHDAVLQKEWSIIKQLNTPAEYVGSDVGVVFPPAQSAVLFPDEGRFDVRKFLFGLLATETGKKIRVFEESAVLGMNVAKKDVQVKTERGTVHNASVILATGSPAELLPETKNLFSPVKTYALLAQYPKRVNLADALLWDTGHPYHYLRLVNERTVMLGGEDHPAHEQHDAGKRFAALERFLRENLSGDYSITHAWTGTLYDSADELPFATEHPRYRNKVIFVSGLAGNGIVMGALAGTIAASLAIGTPHPASELFSLRRANMTLLESKPKTPIAAKHKKTKTSGEKNKAHAAKNTTPLLRFAIPVLLFFLFLVPGYSFFHLRGGFSFLSGLALTSLSHALFPLVGLYAFFFVWSQVMIGTNRDWLKQYFPGIMRFHRAEGVFALLFACLHPVLLLIGVGLTAYFAKTYVPQPLHLYIWLGYVQLTLIIMTAGTALLMRLSFIRKIWRWIHYANYLVFVSVWVHSWFLGSDVQTTNLRYLWFFYGGTFVLTVFAYSLRSWKTRGQHMLIGMDTSEGFVAVGAVASFTQDQPHCVEVNGKKLVLVRHDKQFFALENVCSHAGGPLCEGTVEDGTVIVCPWHGSRFDMKTGAVISGAARRLQTRYDVRVQNGNVLVRAAQIIDRV